LEYFNVLLDVRRLLASKLEFCVGKKTHQLLSSILALKLKDQIDKGGREVGMLLRSADLRPEMIAAMTSNQVPYTDSLAVP